MKRRLVALVFIGLSSSFFLQAQKIISFNDKIELFTDQKYVKEQISYEQLKEDLEFASYVLNMGYAGNDKMLDKGFDEKSSKDAVMTHFEGKEVIYTDDLIRVFNDNLKPYIKDSHFQLIGKKQIYTMIEKYTCYWTDCYVEKRGEDFYSISNTVGINPDLKYCDDQQNLYYYPSKGSSVYRIAKLSKEPLNSIDVSFDNKSYCLEVFNDGAIEKTNAKYKAFDSKDSAYIALNTFFLPYLDSPDRKSKEIIFNKFIECGYKYGNKKNLILDMRSNEGGDAAYTVAMFYVLYSGKNNNDFSKLIPNMSSWFVDSFSLRENLISPVSCKTKYLLKNNRNQKPSKKEVSLLSSQIENPEKVIETAGYKKSKLFSKESKFKGKIIILTDRNSASAGEIIIPLAKEIFGSESVSVIGENTSGSAMYWDVATICLPNSKAGIHTAFAKNKMIEKYDYWHGEGIGFYPDYWSTGQDLNETIFLVTQDEEMKEKLKGISSRLM